jgi:hypothetical protein
MVAPIVYTKTALDVVKDVAYGLGVPAPTSLITTPDSVALQWRSLLEDVAEDLRDTRAFIQQKRSYSFDTEDGRSSYPLPADFWAAIFDTQWDQTNSWQLTGPLSDANYDFRLYAQVFFDNREAFRIFGPDAGPYTSGGQFQINPAGTATTYTLSFDYLSRNLFIPKYWLPSTAYTSGTYVSCNGNIYYCNTNGTSSTTPISGTSASITDGTTNWSYNQYPYEEVRADADLMLFDDDLMKAGLKAFWLDAKGQPNADKALASYEKSKDAVIARFKGSYRTSLATPQMQISANIPEGSWSV